MEPHGTTPTVSNNAAPDQLSGGEAMKDAVKIYDKICDELFWFVLDVSADRVGEHQIYEFMDWLSGDLLEARRLAGYRQTPKDAKRLDKLFATASKQFDYPV